MQLRKLLTLHPPPPDPYQASELAASHSICSYYTVEPSADSPRIYSYLNLCSTATSLQ